MHRQLNYTLLLAFVLCITALTFSSLQFAQKLGLAVGAGLAGVILGLFGFVANEVQTATSLAGIRFMFSVMPATLAVLGAAAIYFYRIDSDTNKRQRSLLPGRVHRMTERPGSAATKRRRRKPLPYPRANQPARTAGTAV